MTLDECPNLKRVSKNDYTVDFVFYCDQIKEYYHFLLSKMPRESVRKCCTTSEHERCWMSPHFDKTTPENKRIMVETKHDFRNLTEEVEERER